MKLENEPGFAVQTALRKSYNPFDSDDEDADGFVKSNINAYDIKGFEKNDESLTFHLGDSDISWEEAIFGHSLKSSPPTLDANGVEHLFRKDTQLFTDKTVTECELPELMVCYKENVHHSVKDIGIDEGVPAHDKVCVKSRNNHDHGSENLSSILPLNGDTNGDLIQDMKEDSMKGSELHSEELECGTDDSIKVVEFKHDLSNKETDSSWQSTGDETMMTGVAVHDTRDHQLSETDELSYAIVDKKGNEVSEEEHGKDNASLDQEKEFSTKPSIMSVTKAITESIESQTEEPTSPPSSELPVSQESADSDVANALSYNSKVDFGSIILDFNSSSPISGKQEHEEDKAQQNDVAAAEKLPESQTMRVEKPPKPQTMSRHDDGAPGMDKWVHEETSFSAEMPPPASITYMGLNSRCGSISLRSESSTGSTRSFAFPVLQTEWNSSPVRMAKADQRHNIHKHRGWVHSLMCCRF